MGSSRPSATRFAAVLALALCSAGSGKGFSIARTHQSLETIIRIRTNHSSGNVAARVQQEALCLFGSRRLGRRTLRPLHQFCTNAPQSEEVPEDTHSSESPYLCGY